MVAGASPAVHLTRVASSHGDHIMTSGPDDSPFFADVAAEPAEESVAAEDQAVGDEADIGGTVPPDQEQ